MPLKIRRGDLVALEVRRSYTWSDFSKEVRDAEIVIYTVTNLTRAGEIAKVQDDRYGRGSGYPVPLSRVLHRTGRWWLLPQDRWDTAKVAEIAGQHVYPGSTTPRAFPSIEAAREALRPARLGSPS